MQSYAPVDENVELLNSLEHYINTYFIKVNNFVNSITAGFLESVTFNSIYHNGYKRIKRKKQDGLPLDFKETPNTEGTSSGQKLQIPPHHDKLFPSMGEGYLTEIKNILLRKITGADIEERLGELTQLYQQVGDAFIHFSRMLDGWLSESEPGRSAHYFSPEGLTEILALLERCQYGNLYYTLTTRRIKLRKLDMDGTSLAILESYLNNFRDNCETIRQSLLLLSYKYELLNSLADAVVQESKYEELNKINSQDVPIKGRKFQFEPTFVKEYKKVPPEVKRSSINALVKLKGGKDLVALGGSSIRLHNLTDFRPLIWKIDVIRKHWQISLHIKGNLFTLIFLKTHEKMDQIYR